MSASEPDATSRPATSLWAVPRFPWSAFTAVMRTTFLVWIVLRLMLAAIPPVFALVYGPPFTLTPYFGGVRTSVLLTMVVVGLTLFDARRMNERVFFLDLGLPEVAVGAVSLVSTLSCEILLLVARSNLTGG